MGTDIIKTLSDGIDMVAKKLGVAVDKIYPVLMKQAQYDMTMDFVWITISLLMIIASIITINFCLKVYRKNKEDSNDNYREERKKRDKQEISMACGIISCIVIVFFLLVTFACLNEIIQIRINPEWYIFNNYIKTLIK